jgi:hypothetical protein
VPGKLTLVESRCRTRIARGVTGVCLTWQNASPAEGGNAGG